MRQLLFLLRSRLEDTKGEYGGIEEEEREKWSSAKNDGILWEPRKMV